MKKIKKIRTWFSSKKLKQKVRYLFLLIVAMYSLVLFFIYLFVLKKNFESYNLKNNRNTMVSIENNINTELHTVNSMSQLLMSNKSIVGYLKEEKQDSSSAQVVLSNVYDVTNTFGYISSVYIFKNNGEYVHTNASDYTTEVDMDIINKPQWKKEIEERAGGMVLRVNGDGAFILNKGGQVVSLIRIINDVGTQKPIGMLVVNISTRMFQNVYQDMGDEKHFSFVYKDKVFYQDEEIEEIQGIEIGDKQYDHKTVGNIADWEIVSYYRVEGTPFIVVGVEKISYFKIFSTQTIGMVLVIIAITVIALVMIGLFISVNITTPIERLVQSMNGVKSGYFHRVSLSIPDDEIGDLKNSYNNMLIEINSLINELIEKEKSMQKAELAVLQEQIKPHFLYNTLDTIGYLALHSSSEKVYDAIETLGNFYQKFLSNGSKEITLREEIGIVKDYLKLQKLRYEDIFEDYYEIEEGLLEISIPKLILQPLVENSLYHGVRLKGEKGIIKISAFSKDGMMHIVVYDSGVGINAEQIEKILNYDSEKSFGFKGTIDRIRYHYNIQEVYEIRSKQGEYTEVDIMIPL